MTDEELTQEEVQTEEAATNEEVASSSVQDNAELEALRAEVAQLKASQVTQQTATQAVQEDDSDELTSLMFSDPKAFMQRVQAEATKAAVAQIAPALAPMYLDHTTKSVVGDNEHARDYARRMLQKGIDVNDPDVADMLKRSATSYAQEKAPKVVTVRGDRSDAIAPAAIDASLRAQADEFARIAGIPPLSDEKIREAV